MNIDNHVITQISLRAFGDTILPNNEKQEIFAIKIELKCLKSNVL